MPLICLINITFNPPSRWLPTNSMQEGPGGDNDTSFDFKQSSRASLLDDGHPLDLPCPCQD